MYPLIAITEGNLTKLNVFNMGFEVPLYSRISLYIIKVDDYFHTSMLFTV